MLLVNFNYNFECDWLIELSDYRCPITANCPITLSDYNFAD